MALQALITALDQLLSTDPSQLCDAESVVVLERQLSRLECLVAKATSAFEASGEWALDGARTPAHWLAVKTHVPKESAKRHLRRGRAIAQFPVCADAWASGDIGPAHVDRMDRASNDITRAAFERDEALIVDHARNLEFGPFCSLMGYWEQLADPDGAEDEEMRRRARRDAYLTPSVGGMWLGQMTLDPISGAIVSGELRRLEQDLFEEDWAKATEELGRDPKSTELCRTSAQRRADALVEMATRSKGAPADGRRPEPLFSILVGYETLHGRICELSTGQVVTPGSLLPWLDGALFERAVFAPGKRVEVSVTSRLFTGGTRRAIELRDQECTHPYCDTPADQCQIDHITPWASGGQTTQENGRVLCGFHNRLRNQRPPPSE
jgi:hypothetical protein